MSRMALSGLLRQDFEGANRHAESSFFLVDIKRVIEYFSRKTTIQIEPSLLSPAQGSEGASSGSLEKTAFFMGKKMTWSGSGRRHFGHGAAMCRPPAA